MKGAHGLDPLYFSNNRCLFKYLITPLFKVPESFWSLLWATALGLVGKDGHSDTLWGRRNVDCGAFTYWEKTKTKITGLFFSDGLKHPKKSHRRNMAQFPEVSTLLQVLRAKSYNKINEVLRNKIKCLVCRNFKILAVRQEKFFLSTELTYISLRLCVLSVWENLSNSAIWWGCRGREEIHGFFISGNMGEEMGR